jgi:hypothetical protein
MSYSPPPFPLPPATTRPKSRLNNWKILVPVVLGSLIVCLGLFAFILMSFIYSMFRSSYPYKFAIQTANQSAEVAAEVGTPFRVGWLMTGNVSYNNSDGDVNLTIPISGAKGRGRIIVVAKERAQQWRFETIEVDVTGKDRPIQLPNPAPMPAETASPDSE